MNTSRECNKVILTNKFEIDEIESWVDFASRNENYEEEQISLPRIWKKEESKESVYTA